MFSTPCPSGLEPTPLTKWKQELHRNLRNSPSTSTPNDKTGETGTGDEVTVRKVLWEKDEAEAEEAAKGDNSALVEEAEEAAAVFMLPSREEDQEQAPATTVSETGASSVAGQQVMSSPKFYVTLADDGQGIAAIRGGNTSEDTDCGVNIKPPSREFNYLPIEEEPVTPCFIGPDTVDDDGRSNLIGRISSYSDMSSEQDDARLEERLMTIDQEPAIGFDDDNLEMVEAERGLTVLCVGE
jgi:hypothetical protein